MKHNFVSKFLYKFNKPRIEEDKRDKLIDKAVDHDYNSYLDGQEKYLSQVNQYLQEDNGDE